MGYPIFLDRPICIINVFHHATMQPGELGCCQVIKEVPKIQMEYRERTRHVVDDFGSQILVEVCRTSPGKSMVCWKSKNLFCEPFGSSLFSTEPGDVQFIVSRTVPEDSQICAGSSRSHNFICRCSWCSCK